MFTLLHKQEATSVPGDRRRPIGIGGMLRFAAVLNIVHGDRMLHERATTVSDHHKRPPQATTARCRPLGLYKCTGVHIHAATEEATCSRGVSAPSMSHFNLRRSFNQIFLIFLYFKLFIRTPNSQRLSWEFFHFSCLIRTEELSRRVAR